MPEAGTGRIRIGNGAGFWGDRIDAPIELARHGRLDVLTLEYLAELTMAILAHLRAKDPLAGFATDFIEVMAGLAPLLGEQSELHVVTNAGGLNPSACLRKCGEVLTRAGLGWMPLASVTGDDVLSEVTEWLNDGVDLSHLETGEPFDSVTNRLVAANVYLGCSSIVESLKEGARVVVTGRVADASLTVGPVVERFGWSFSDWDRLAGASVAGHLLECGAQSTGGLWRDWMAMPDPAGIGYPIAEVAEDGHCVITKPEGTGGLVSLANVAEQLLYEIGDPSAYLTPDVTVDLTSIRLSQVGSDRVRVDGARGNAPGDRLKLSAIYRDGWSASGMLAVVGRQAESKARAAGQVVIERLRRAGLEPESSLIEVLGAGDVVPGVLPRSEPLEVVLRVSVRDSRREPVARFCREMAPLVTAGPAGIAGYATGRPEPRPAFGYWPALVPRDRVHAKVRVRAAEEWAAR